MLVLLVLDRGVTLAEMGLAMAAQSAVVLLLELPTGGLADVVGARPVLVAANAAELASIGVLLSADSLGALAVVWALQGVYRALESGPLEAWYVTATLAIDPEADIDADLAKSGVVLGIAIAAGSLASSALVAFAPTLGVEALLLPVVAAMALRAIDLMAIVALVTPNPAVSLSGPTSESRPLAFTIRATAAEVPAVIGDTVRLIMASPGFAALLAVELMWGIGLVGFETLFPPRLAEVLDDPVRAATLLGPVGTAAFLSFAVGSSGMPRLSKWLGRAGAAAALRVTQGATVAVLAFLLGPLGLIVAYLATMAVHGASNALHSALVHSAIDSAHRTTALSANSMAGHVGGGIGLIVLGRLATGAGIPTAIIVAALFLAAAAPFYLVGSVRQPAGTASG